jgi:hypothetical protein
MFETSSSMVRDAINSYKEELVVITNEQAKYAWEYSNLCEQNDAVNMIQHHQRLARLSELSRAASSLRETLTNYIKAGAALCRWMEGKHVRLNLPQMNLSVQPTVELILGGVGKGASELAKNDSEYVFIMQWATFFDTAEVLCIDAGPTNPTDQLTY